LTERSETCGFPLSRTANYLVEPEIPSLLGDFDSTMMRRTTKSFCRAIIMMVDQQNAMDSSLL
jgi:hypothetical protein